MASKRDAALAAAGFSASISLMVEGGEIRPEFAKIYARGEIDIERRAKLQVLDYDGKDRLAGEKLACQMIDGIRDKLQLFDDVLAREVNMRRIEIEAGTRPAPEVDLTFDPTRPKPAEWNK